MFGSRLEAWEDRAEEIFENLDPATQEAWLFHARECARKERERLETLDRKGAEK